MYIIGYIQTSTYPALVLLIGLVLLSSTTEALPQYYHSAGTSVLQVGAGGFVLLFKTDNTIAPGSLGPQGPVVLGY